MSRTRLSPDARRSQLLDLGVRLFAHRGIGEITVDLLASKAGISRGLLYHYFGNIGGFQEAVVRRAAEQMVALTEPPTEGAVMERVTRSIGAYVDFVDSHYEAYLTLARGAASGNETLAAVYDEARSAIADRIVSLAGGSGAISSELGLDLPDTPAARLAVRGWQKMAEEMVLTWRAAPDDIGITRDELVNLLISSLAAVVGSVSEGALAGHALEVGAAPEPG